MTLRRSISPNHKPHSLIEWPDARRANRMGSSVHRPAVSCQIIQPIYEPSNCVRIAEQGLVMSYMYRAISLSPLLFQERINRSFHNDFILLMLLLSCFLLTLRRSKR
ncbi:hypothetical protein M438DRAFT_79997 [Aureobasidium pullulans EXF-150]|uniref:Uncharacterized protein n=1 Tax=Aureobasidium pullulans EXF-150 TaxID=1043002 RepID=A0A074XX73_AURPU|nr:uncharacterized protein M438DRAFT_79997 [Aureobasidium pullulans EXF-150]KEQ88229.1 hypothetical protein M438DRAFT_79997 [Aureobasidium pullulans EXF-150]